MPVPTKDVFNILLICRLPAISMRATNCTRPGGQMAREPAMLRLIMKPANAVCDAMRIKDEGERGMVRMLVNMLLLTLVSVIVFVVIIEAV